ncbi:hypothetical protein PV336_35250 [Streptomyces sp. MI02-2A]|uniref:hypothetical protein n=1 Tax=unclassified Streptomyces TaxID=2593676 RepID=UPI000AD253D4|nr:MULTISPECIES: hypothetical protein [unclassified Streptomyces]MDX3264398.1 hypothetical protein [Streptomyces sp. MI02-2A]
MYLPQVRQIEWLGGAPAVAALFPEGSVSLPWLVRHIHTDDRPSLRRLLHSDNNRRSWTTLRFQGDQGDWHRLACQTRRIQLGYEGPEQIFGMIRDDTCDEARRQEMVAAVEAQRRRADEIAEFSSALITASTEQELRQVVLTRLAATFAGTGAALALVDDEHLSVSSDAGLPSWHVDALHCRSLDEQGPLPHVIRTGEPLFIRNQEDLLSRWPNGDAAPLAWPGPDVAMSISPLGLGGDQAPGAWVVTYDSGHHPSPDEKAFISRWPNSPARRSGGSDRSRPGSSWPRQFKITCSRSCPSICPAWRSPPATDPAVPGSTSAVTGTTPSS